MSYILDALNKAEKDRQQNTPDLTETQHRTTSPPAPEKNNKIWLLGLVFIALLGATWLVLSPKEGIVPMIQKTPQDAQPTAHITPITSPKPVVAEVIKPVGTAKLVPNHSVEKNMPNIMGLDENIRRQLPSIQISAHVFGENASKRMVIINNRVFHEGDYITEQLQLLNITQQGIVLKFDSETFTMNIKDKWPPY